MLLSQNETNAMNIVNDIKWDTENIIYIRDSRDFEIVSVYVADGGVIWVYDVHDDGYISKALMSPSEGHEVKRRKHSYD